MELYTLKINVTNQRLSFGENPPEIYSGDQSIDFVEFTFEDDMWNFPDIWAIFSRFKGTSYQVALEDNKVMIPAEVMQKKGYVYIGLMATDGENVQTSSVLQYSIGQGSTNVDAITPSASIYEQFLADLDAYQTAVSDLASIEARITTAESTVSDLETRITSAESSVSEMEADVTALQTNVTGLQTSLTALQTSVTALESAVPTLQSSVSELQTNLTNLESRLMTISTCVASLETRLTTAQASMTDLEDGLTDAEGRLTTIENQITDAQADIEEIETAIQQNNIVTDVTAEGISLVDNHIADLSFMCVTDTASGDVASFPDGSGVAMKKAEVSLEPIQDLSHGDPSPTNICPIDGYEDVGVSVSGQNLLSPKAYGNVGYNPAVGTVISPTAKSTQWSDNGDGTFSMSLASWEQANMVSPPLKAGQYTIGLTTVTAGMRYGLYVVNADNTLNRISQLRNGTAANEVFSVTTILTDGQWFVMYIAGGDGVCTIKEPQLVKSATPMTYEPYAGTDYAIDLGRTVYGGTVDLASGRLVVDRAMVDLGTMNWTYEQNRDLFVALLVPRAKSLFDAVCSNYPFVGSYSVLVDKSCGYIYGYYVAIKDSSYTDATLFKTAMNGVQLVYELTTPQVYQLTPQQIQTLIGTNNVWSEDGAIEVEYIANLKDYIDKKINA